MKTTSSPSARIWSMSAYSWLIATLILGVLAGITFAGKPIEDRRGRPRAAAPPCLVPRPDGPLIPLRGNDATNQEVSPSCNMI